MKSQPLILLRFPKGNAKAQICGLSLTCRFRPIFCIGSLVLCQSSLSLPSGACTRSWPQSTQSPGDAQQLFGESKGKAPASAHGQLLHEVHNAVSRVHVSLMSSKSPIYHSPSLFVSPTHEAHNTVLWMERERNGLLW